MAASKNRKWIYIGLAVLVVFILLISVFGKGESYTLVYTDKVELRSVTETVIADGFIHPEVEVKISSLVTGEITGIYIREGDSVRKGQLLLTINPELLESNLDRAEAGLDNARANKATAEARLEQARARELQARSNYERNKKLFEQKVIAQAEFDVIEVEYRTAQAEVKAAEKAVEAAVYTIRSFTAGFKEAQQSLSQTRIVSPMDGIVSKLNVEKGERVVGTAQMAGTELLRVADMSTVEIRVNVSESDIVRVAVGDTANIEVGAYENQQFKGLVREISNSSNNTGATGIASATEQVTNFEVRIRLLRESYDSLMHDLGRGKVSPFLPGMTGMAEIMTRTVDKGVTVPIEAVTTRKAMGDSSTRGNDKPRTVVYTLQDGKAKEVEVKTGVQDSKYFTILQGLKEGETVITGPANTVARVLKDGSLVKVTEKDEIFKKQKKN